VLGSRILSCHQYGLTCAGSSLQRKEEARQAQEWKEKKWQKDHAYDEIFTEDNMASSNNQDRDADWEDDFM
jgi:hypothetical protein